MVEGKEGVIVREVFVITGSIGITPGLRRTWERRRDKIGCTRRFVVPASTFIREETLVALFARPFVGPFTVVAVTMTVAATSASTGPKETDSGVHFHTARFGFLNLMLDVESAELRVASIKPGVANLAVFADGFAKAKVFGCADLENCVIC
jgi:hypothetical protein